ncbi:MAG UNVERIFIED_CONTAM: heme ABC exporter ATP-binding protein CcmA [Rickettsiaceae bacterium]|jgi:heme exporter protein A
MISLEDISYDIRGKTLFKNISLSILPASIVKVVGNNGMGKTTLLRIMAHIQSPKSGRILIDDSEISYIGHNIAVKDDLTVLENLKLWAEIWGNEMLIPASIKYMKLDNIINNYCYSLSSGNKQKVAIARLIFSSSQIWILDEIDTHLDEQNVELLKNLMTTKAQNNGIIIYSSHSNLLPFSFTINLGK